MFLQGTALAIARMKAGLSWTANNATLSAQDGSLVAYWKGEDTSDSFGSHTLTNNNSATFTAGKNNNAFEFSGTNQYMSAADSDDWDFGTGAFTISLWVNFDGLGNSNYALINHGGGGSDVSDYEGWWLNHRGGALDDLSFGTRISTTNYIKTESWAPSIDTWYHIVVTRDDSDNLRMYVDGSELGSPTASYNHNINVGAYLLRLGERKDGTHDLDGQIDEVAIWKGYGADATFVSNLYNSGTGAFRV